MVRVVIPTSQVVLLRLITAATAISDGYDLGVVNGVSMILANTYDSRTISFFVAVLPAFVGLGAVAGAFLADTFGRKPVLVNSYFLLIVGASVMAIPSSLWLVMVGRALVGLGIGIGGVVGTVYMAEISPTKNRGSFVAQETLFLSTGLLLGYLANYALMQVKYNYNIMLGLGAVLPALCLVALLTVGRALPESPHWERFNSSSESADQEPLTGDVVSTGGSDEQSLGWRGGKLSVIVKEFLSAPNAGTAMMVGILQPLCGVGPILYFSDLTFSNLETMNLADGAVVEQAPEIAMSSIFIGVTKVSVLILSTLVLMDRVGRRTMLMVSSGMLVVALAFISAVMLWFPTHTDVLLAGFCCTIAAYAFGWNCVPSVYPTELLPTRVRTFGLSFITIVGRVISVTNAFLYPLFGLRNPGVWFSVFAVTNVVSLVLVFLFAKETLNKPLILGSKPRGDKHAETSSDREEIIDHVDDSAVVPIA